MGNFLRRGPTDDQNNGQPPAGERVVIPGGDHPPAEERVLQNHYDDLRRVIVHPLGVATQLVQEGVASSELVEAVNRQGTTTSQKNVAILDAVRASIHSDPERFEVVMGVLENSTEAAPLVRRMKEQLSELFTVSVYMYLIRWVTWPWHCIIVDTLKGVSIHSSERLTQGRGLCYQ